MAATFGIRVKPRLTRKEALSAEIDFDPYRTDSIQEIIDAWLPLTFAVNSLNRAMGNQDLYPSVRSLSDRQTRLRARGGPRQPANAMQG